MTDYEKLSLKLQLYATSALSLILRAVDRDAPALGLDASDYNKLADIHEVLSWEVDTAVNPTDL